MKTLNKVFYLEEIVSSSIFMTYLKTNILLTNLSTNERRNKINLHLLGLQTCNAPEAQIQLLINKCSDYLYEIWFYEIWRIVPIIEFDIYLGRYLGIHVVPHQPKKAESQLVFVHKPSAGYWDWNLPINR